MHRERENRRRRMGLSRQKPACAGSLPEKKAIRPGGGGTGPVACRPFGRRDSYEE